MMMDLQLYLTDDLLMNAGRKQKIAVIVYLNMVHSLPMTILNSISKETCEIEINQQT